MSRRSEARHDAAAAGRGLELFRLWGFSVRLDPSWFLLAFLITWSLATGLFPATVEGLAPATYWAMGALGALGLFVSIVLHELAHSLVARRDGIEMRGITLFVFGGVAEMGGEPPSPRAELRMAIAGPIASVAIAGAFELTFRLGSIGEGWARPTLAVVRYLAVINAVLAAFNLLPAFPLDGGRVLRALLWRARGDLRWATRISSRVGLVFGAALIALGLVTVLLGNLIGGIWWFVLGLFLRGAARSSHQRVLLRETLGGEPVRRFMRRDPVTVPRSVSVRDLVEDYVFRHHFKMFPVVDDGRVVGCVTTRDIQRVPRDEWDRRSTGEIARGCDETNTVSPDDDAMAALARMGGDGTSRLLVIDDDRLVGVLTRRDLSGFVQRKLELEGPTDVREAGR